MRLLRPALHLGDCRSHAVSVKFDSRLAITTDHVCRTWPTTYGLLQDFVGRAESTFEPTKTYSSEGKDCDGTLGTTALTLPSTLDQGSLIVPLGVSSPTLKAGPLPETVIAYLDSFPTVHEQLNSIPITSCAPALPVRTACTTVLTSASTSVSCEKQDVCVTLLETVIETNTHTPFWPTLNGSLTDIKRSAARLTTETGEAETVLATAESLVVPSGSSDEHSMSTSELEASSSAQEEPASTSAGEPSEGQDEVTPSPTPDIEPATTGSTSTGLGGHIVSGLGSGTVSSSPSASAPNQSTGSDTVSESVSDATTSQQDQQSAATASSSACQRLGVSARDMVILLFSAVVLTTMGVV